MKKKKKRKFYLSSVKMRRKQRKKRTGAHTNWWAKRIARELEDVTRS